MILFTKQYSMNMKLKITVKVLILEESFGCFKEVINL